MPEILILTSETGGGHMSLAEALREQLVETSSVELADPIPTVVKLGYTLISRHARWLWSAGFRITNSPATARIAHWIGSSPYLRALHQAISRSRADLVIATHPFLTHEAARVLRRLRRSVPLAVLYSDPAALHSAWFTHRTCAAVFAPTRETHRQALEAGMPPRRVHLTGWPVRRQFSSIEQARGAVLQPLGLRDDAFTLFLQGGGDGGAGFSTSVEQLLTIPNLQIVLAAGRNDAVFRRFSGVERVRPLAFTRQIAPFMAAADLIVGKAGPNVLFEATTLGKPFLATTCIPGQESPNFAFIQRHGLGWVASEPRAQLDLVRSLAENPTRVRAMADSISMYRAWNTEATASIPARVQDLLARQDDA